MDFNLTINIFFFLISKIPDKVVTLVLIKRIT